MADDPHFEQLIERSRNTRAQAAAARQRYREIQRFLGTQTPRAIARQRAMQQSLSDKLFLAGSIYGQSESEPDQSD